MICKPYKNLMFRVKRQSLRRQIARNKRTCVALEIHLSHFEQHGYSDPGVHDLNVTTKRLIGQLDQLEGEHLTMTKAPSQNPYGVAAGQIWADNDIRSSGRTLQVDAIDGDHALCTTVTNTDLPVTRDMRGKPARIKLTRFALNTRGYKRLS